MGQAPSQSPSSPLQREGPLSGNKGTQQRLTAVPCCTSSDVRKTAAPLNRNGFILRRGPMPPTCLTKSKAAQGRESTAPRTKGTQTPRWAPSPRPSATWARLLPLQSLFQDKIFYTSSSLLSNPSALNFRANNGPPDFDAPASPNILRCTEFNSLHLLSSVTNTLTY